MMEAMHGENPEADIELSREEMENLTAAFKKEEFREMLNDYVKEVHDPVNVKKYEDEVKQLEKERGVEVTFLHPEPGYVIKTSVNGDKKAFVNLCTNSNVAQPSCERAVNNEGGDSPQVGFRWSLPYSISPPREDLDRAGHRCVVYDVLFHPYVLRMARANPRFQKMVEGTAMDGLESHFAVRFDRNNIRHPKLKFKGYPTATVIRQCPKGCAPTDGNGFVRYPDPKNSWIERAKRAKEKADKKTAEASKRTTSRSENKVDGATQPKYVLKYRDEMDIQDFSYSPSGQPAGVSRIPKELVVEIQLPLISSAAQVDLDVTERTLVLMSAKPVAYHLNVHLPHRVDADEAKAKFDVGTRKLAVTLPVKSVPRHTYNALPPESEEDHVVNEEKPVEETGIPEAQLGVGNIRVHYSCDESFGEESVPPLVTEISSGYRTKSECDDNDDDDVGDDDDDDLDVHENIQDSNSDDIVIYTPKVPASTYSVPMYNLSQTKDKLVVALVERNVHPDSVTEQFEADGTVCCIVLHSMGSGFVPFHFSLCVACPPDKRFSFGDFSCSVEEESTVLVIGKDASCHGDWNTVLVGLDSDHLEEKQLITPANALLRLSELENDEENSVASKTHVSVVSHSAEKVVIELQHEEPEAVQPVELEVIESANPVNLEAAGNVKPVKLEESEAVQMGNPEELKDVPPAKQEEPDALKPEKLKEPEMEKTVKLEEQAAMQPVKVSDPVQPEPVEEATTMQPLKETDPVQPQKLEAPVTAKSVENFSFNQLNTSSAQDKPASIATRMSNTALKSDASSDDASHDENHDSVSEVVSDPMWITSQRPQKPRQKVRSMSESSSDMHTWKPKGILKLRHFGRSISESGSDDLSWSSQELISSPDVDIPEESSADEQGMHSKKSVRFNEVVSRTLFRTNSSILGQRKKNQRKQRNKKRAQQGSNEKTDERNVSSMDQGQETDSDKEPFSPLSTSLPCAIDQDTNVPVFNDGVVNGVPDDNANTARTVDNHPLSETTQSCPSTNDDNYYRNKESYEFDENDNAQEGMSTSGDEGSDWQVVKESKRSRERKKKKKVKKDDVRPQTILNWEDRRLTGEEHKTHCPVDFSNVVMYDLDD